MQDFLQQFGNTVGATTGNLLIALAIAFGIGGKDTAARAVERWSERLGEQTRRDA